MYQIIIYTLFYLFFIIYIYQYTVIVILLAFIYLTSSTLLFIYFTIIYSHILMRWLFYVQRERHGEETGGISQEATLAIFLYLYIFLFI